MIINPNLVSKMHETLEHLEVNLVEFASLFDLRDPQKKCFFDEKVSCLVYVLKECGIGLLLSPGDEERRN